MAWAKNSRESTAANLGFEETLWAAADKLRNNMDAAEYKHVIPGLIFLKYLSDAFEERHSYLEREHADPKSRWYIAEPEVRHTVIKDPDKNRWENIFQIPKEARWSYIQQNAKPTEIEKHGFLLTLGRYVRAEDGEDDMEPFPKKMSYLTREHSEQMKEGSRLDDEIKRNLAGLGFPV